MSPAARFPLSTPLHRLGAITAAFMLVGALARGSPVNAQQPEGATGGPPANVEQPAAVTGGSPANAEQPPATASLSRQQIDQLVAPVALYPDDLLGQIFAASTYPFDVVMAARWSAANPKVRGRELETAMQGQRWDPSVKALTAVPQVLQMMNDKPEWTKQLGEAYLAQPDDVAAAVQRLRARADGSGNLKPSKELNVRRVPAPQPVADVAAPEYIIIEPVQPDIVYVPIYDPWVVYGVWPYPAYRPFYWCPPGYVTVGALGFGAPIVVGAALWAHYNWHSRRVGINVARFNTFNRVALANIPANQSWHHNPARRGNVSYGNPALQQRFGTPGGVNANRAGAATSRQSMMPSAGPGGRKELRSPAGIGANARLTSTGSPGARDGAAVVRAKQGHTVDPGARRHVNMRQNAPKTLSVHSAGSRQSFAPRHVSAARHGNVNQKGARGPR